ncbi:hypothetical protein [Azospirillum sp. TSO22-1]|uniref:hypothetical protein n=1 Tax=Azospirillum sp. TSO22-1 TaxID=716789 RepID=UPI000D61F09E|nr:hypothetical protein [Azospirillum sp. TSO22-1]PWC42126.1 hypothetical protein TSO221_22345 [Azospirillum sp. TSO22-1]
MANLREKGKIPHQEWPAIRARYAGGESLASIARDYGCTGPAIRYIVNRPAAAADDDRPVPAAPPPGRAPRPEGRPTETPARAEPPAAAGIDPDLRRRVSSEIASFLAVFDSFLTESSPDSYDQLIDATDRLMRVAARTRIELERARTAEHAHARSRLLTPAS